MSGWEGSDRKSRLPGDWAKRRAKQLAKDGHRCTWRLPSGARCPRPATDVDHIDEKTDDHDRLQSLCATHHATKTALAAARFKREHRQKRFRPAEDHPGTLS